MISNCLSVLFLKLLIVCYTFHVAASIFFAIQGLVVGVQSYNDPYQEGCQRTAGIWMIVYGSLIISRLISPLCCACKYSRVRTENGIVTFIFKIDFVQTIFELVIFSWLCYGMSLISNPVEAWEISCVDSQYQLFSTMVMYMFCSSFAMIPVNFFFRCLEGFITPNETVTSLLQQGYEYMV